MTQPLPLWQQRLSRSLHLSRSKPESRYLQLATVDASGAPDIRTLVFRGFNETGTSIYLISDTRTQKYQQVLKDNRSSICWYFTGTREQYRFAGTTSIHYYDGALAQRLWQNLSVNGKAQFLWGEPRSPIDDERHQTDQSNEDDVAIPEHFCVIEVEIQTLDYLNLQAPFCNRPQTREIYTKSASGWQCQSVIP